MVSDNVVNIQAQQLSHKIMNDWLAAYSDNGAIWADSNWHLNAAKRGLPEEVIQEAYELARERWKKMHNVAD
jgi:ABC-type sugar transport system substrate-binding protein